MLHTALVPGVVGLHGADESLVQQTESEDSFLLRFIRKGDLRILFEGLSELEPIFSWLSREEGKFMTLVGHILQVHPGRELDDHVPGKVSHQSLLRLVQLEILFILFCLDVVGGLVGVLFLIDLEDLCKDLTVDRLWLRTFLSVANRFDLQADSLFPRRDFLAAQTVERMQHEVIDHFLSECLVRVEMRKEFTWLPFLLSTESHSFRDLSKELSSILVTGGLTSRNGFNGLVYGLAILSFLFWSYHSDECFLSIIQFLTHFF